MFFRNATRIARLLKAIERENDRLEKDLASVNRLLDAGQTDEGMRLTSEVRGANRVMRAIIDAIS